MPVSFPNRVWENGVSREPTLVDWHRRHLLAELLASDTTHERRAEIRGELEKA